MLSNSIENNDYSQDRPIWKDTETFPDYEICQYGVVRNKKTSKIMSVWLRAGYPTVSLCRDGKQYKVLLHRLLALAFIPNPNNKPQINHRDGDKQNNDLSNLEWATSSENLTHAIHELNRPIPRGEKHWNAILTQRDIDEIREKQATGNYFHYELAAEYGVGRQTITKIVNNQSWKAVHSLRDQLDVCIAFLEENQNSTNHLWLDMVQGEYSDEH